jgi:hypothetical protein
LTITFPSLQESRGADAQKPTAAAQKTERGSQRPHPVSFTPSFVLIHPTPQEVINLPFTFVF